MLFQTATVRLNKLKVLFKSDVDWFWSRKPEWSRDLISSYLGSKSLLKRN